MIRRTFQQVLPESREVAHPAILTNVQQPGTPMPSVGLRVGSGSGVGVVEASPGAWRQEKLAPTGLLPGDDPS